MIGDDKGNSSFHFIMVCYFLSSSLNVAKCEDAFAGISIVSPAKTQVIVQGVQVQL